jgi:hypothetical protein
MYIMPGWAASRPPDFRKNIKLQTTENKIHWLRSSFSFSLPFTEKASYSFKQTLKRLTHGLINYKDTKTKCSQQKKLTCKGTSRGRCFLEFIDWRYSPSCCMVFRPSFVNYYPSNLLSGSPTPSPLPCVKVQYIQTVCD